ncbi:hypothetical protein SBRY_40064 [Actinacidiphila bryophytorum]|uniref:Uncharacterized protein n=1 Tax=Actinacidiphila bryophytorum TaxID=1436133 RepID=A0A9W4H2A5_9ACTN|nr:hypothetical protein SBRY_40064 [Actinacidiphila bryophytorum]
MAPIALKPSGSVPGRPIGSPAVPLC